MSAPEVIARKDRAAEIVGGPEMLAEMRAAGWVTTLPASTSQNPLFDVTALLRAAMRLANGEVPPKLRVGGKRVPSAVARRQHFERDEDFSKRATARNAGGAR
jgi:hypothetical protein